MAFFEGCERLFTQDDIDAVDTSSMTDTYIGLLEASHQCDLLYIHGCNFNVYMTNVYAKEDMSTSDQKESLDKRILEGIKKFIKFVIEKLQSLYSWFTQFINKFKNNTKEQKENLKELLALPQGWPQEYKSKFSPDDFTTVTVQELEKVSNGSAGDPRIIDYEDIVDLLASSRDTLVSFKYIISKNKLFNKSEDMDIPQKNIDTINNKIKPLLSELHQLLYNKGSDGPGIYEGLDSMDLRMANRILDMIEEMSLYGIGNLSTTISEIQKGLTNINFNELENQGFSKEYLNLCQQAITENLLCSNTLIKYLSKYVQTYTSYIVIYNKAALRKRKAYMESLES